MPILQSRGLVRQQRPLLQRLVTAVPSAKLSQQVSVGPKSANTIVQGVKEAFRKILSSASGVALSASLVLAPASAETVLRLPASSDPEIFAAQRTLVEAWTIVGESFVDGDFNGHDWETELRTHMVAAFKSPDGGTAYKELEAMLEDLGDPYTRRIAPEDYASFRMSSDGELQGVGLLIANEPRNGHLLVLAPIKGGPAERAGVLPGDEVLSINGLSTTGWTGEKAARLLRGQGGTEVRVQLARRTDQIAGVPGRPEPKPTVQYKELRLRRERVMLSPIFATALPPPPGAAASGPVGYIRLTSFSSNAAGDMAAAIQQLEAQGAGSYVLDLRGNPGGLVQSGIDIARLWMDGEPVVFNVTGRQLGDVVPQHAEAADGAADAGSPAVALTHDPLVVLVNSGSASASEILSGALRDNARATIVGDAPTYGKGRIQSVFELQDGSALFVTIAKYQTPAGDDIDRIGITPDRACMVPSPTTVSSNTLGGSNGSGSSSTMPPFMPGIPVDPSTRDVLLAQLQADACMATAGSLLAAQIELQAQGGAVSVGMQAHVQVAPNVGHVSVHA